MINFVSKFNVKIRLNAKRQTVVEHFRTDRKLTDKWELGIQK